MILPKKVMMKTHVTIHISKEEDIEQEQQDQHIKSIIDQERTSYKIDDIPEPSTFSRINLHKGHHLFKTTKTPMIQMSDEQIKLATQNIVS